MKKLHPIRKMRRAFWRVGQDKQDEALYRSVKPLLDALEVEHNASSAYPETCEVCRLLAAWKEPLK